MDVKEEQAVKEYKNQNERWVNRKVQPPVMTVQVQRDVDKDVSSGRRDRCRDERDGDYLEA
jgi:hypothetical protein